MSEQVVKNRVNVSISNQIATVTLSRADKHNAIDWDMFVALDKVSKSLAKDKQLRAVIVTGDGEDFCSGLDVKSVLAKPATGAKLLFKWWPSHANLAQRVSHNWRKLPVPVIMAIHGRCWGGGLQIALGGDFRIASPDASISIMENKWGLIPDMGGTLALREIMALDHAMYLAMTAKELSSNDAVNCNLITEVANDPLQRAQELAAEFSQRSPDSIAAIKKLYHAAWHKNDGNVLAKESWYQIKVLLKKNQRIAVKRATSEPDKPFKPRQFN